MHATTDVGAEQFFSALQEEYLKVENEGGSGLKKVRARAWDHFLEMGLPSRTCEAYRYFPLQKLYGQTFQKASYVDLSYEQVEPFVHARCTDSVLVFVNGCFREDLSRTGALPSQALLLPLEQAVVKFRALFSSHWAKSLKKELEPFSILNAAIHSKGLFIYLPPQTVVETPVQILHIVSPQKQQEMLFPRVHVFSGKSSRIELINESIALSEEPYFLNAALDFSLEEESCVQLSHLPFKHSQAWHFESIRAQLKKDASFHSISFTEGAKAFRQDYALSLIGENAQAYLSGAWMLGEKSQVHTHVLVDHQAPHCYSSQLFKGVLDDQSVSSFEGKVYVHAEAQKTDAFQLNNNLLLSDFARATSRPNLEIYADDVKASHGSTVGQLDEEQLFYLRSRGIPASVAKGLMIESFCREVTDRFPLSSHASRAADRVKKNL